MSELRTGRYGLSLEGTPARAWQSAACAAIVVLSLAIRLLAWAALVGNHGVPQFDEQGYLHRGEGFAAVARSVADFRRPLGQDLSEAYGGGTWPPLNSMLVGLALTLSDGNLGFARLVQIVPAVLTTLVVFALAARIGGRRAAIAAALAHALLPSFVHYAPLLLSESLYLLALSAWALQLVILVQERTENRLARIVLIGCLAGLAMLTRAVACAAWLVTLGVIGWTAQRQSRKWLELLVAIGTSLLFVLPWQIALHVREGGMPVLSTATGLNLLVANNPWQEEAGDLSLPLLDHHVHERMNRTGERQNVAARRIALTQMAERPAKAFSNTLLQLRRLLAPDRITLRSLETVYFRPLSSSVLRMLYVILLVTIPVLLGGAAAGTISDSSRGAASAILAALVAAHVAPSLVAVSNPRFAQPVLLLATPLFGAFAAHALDRERAGRRWTLCSAVAIILALGTWTLGRKALPAWESSSFYRSASNLSWSLTGSVGSTFDCIELRRENGGGPTLEVSLTTPGYGFADASTRFAWRGTEAGKAVRLELRGRSRELPTPVLTLANGDVAPPVAVSPINRDFWWRWTSVGASSAQVRWCGGEKARGVVRGLEPYQPQPTPDSGRE